MDLKEYGYRPEMYPEITEAQGIPARVTAVHKERYELICEYGEIYGRLKAKEYFSEREEGEEFPVTGDFVRILYNPGGDSRIVQTLPRTTFFSRRDPDVGRGEQAMVANFDYVFIMQSLNHDFNLRRLERYLTLTWQSGAEPVMVLTKADLVENAAPYIDEIKKTAPEVQVHPVSSHTGAGLEKLAEYLQPGKTVCFLGSSGVGKSSLVNALAGEEIMNVNGIREADSKGRHTTTHRQLIRLNCGAMIIDTPGMRELGMWDVSDGLGEAFADVEQFLGRCRFADCRHGSEPGCAVRQAINDGQLLQERWDSYRKLRSEAKYCDDRDSFIRQKQQRNKNLAKQSRQRKLAGEKWKR